MSGKHYACDTLIIGAGLAGISAARKLEKHNRHSRRRDQCSYLVLEADNKIGGRAQSEIIQTPEGKSVIINTAAQWFHRDLHDNAPENPLLKQVRKCDTLIHDSKPTEFWEHGQRVNYDGRIKRINAARRIIDEYPGPEDTDLASLFNASKLGTPSELITTYGETETGGSLDKESVEDMRELASRNLGDFSRSGLSHFVKHYARKIEPNIKLNSPVDRVRWRPGAVEVHTKNGDTYHAKRCIITVSVGVLHSGAIDFQPPLPATHREPLSHIKMRDFNKVSLIFDSAFRFPVNHNTHLDVRTKNGEDIRSEDVFYLARDNGQPLVTTFLGGELGVLCDHNPEAAKKLTIRGLSEIWGDKVRRHLVDTRVTRWGKNEYVLGGYSGVDIGHHDAREQVAVPVAGTLFFAGEALGAKHPKSGRDWSTQMPGAALSGKRAATLVLQAHEKDKTHSHVKRARVAGGDSWRSFG